MDNICKYSIVKRSGNCLETEVDGEVVLMRLDDGVLFSLSHTGRRVWELICSEVGIGTITSTLLEEYDVSEDVCHTEVMSLITQLHKHTFIEIS